MLETLRGSLFLGALGALGVAMIACSGGTAAPGSSGSSGGAATPEQTAEITSPVTGLEITATIAAVTLGDECGASAGRCAQGGSCGGFCQQSNVQMAFNAAVGTRSASVQVESVTLLDSATGALVDTLAASQPQVWNGNGYTAWDQNVAPGGDLKASYNLTAPAWSKIDGSDTSSRSGSSYRRSFKLHVTLRIDGVQVILESTDLNRQPTAVT